MSVALGLFVLIVGSINIINFFNSRQYTERLMDILKKNEGVLPSDYTGTNGAYGFFRSDVYGSSLYNRYFTVTLDGEGLPAPKRYVGRACDFHVRKPFCAKKEKRLYKLLLLRHFKA